MRQRETAVLVASDLHYGKRTSSYNLDVFEQRIAALSERLFRVRTLLGEYDFDELVICLLGDVIDGTCIYPTQQHHQAETRATRQALDLAAHLSRFVAAQADVWGRVRIETVPGNHGRSGFMTAEDDNWDSVMYELLRSAIRDPRIVMPKHPDGDPFLRVMNVYTHGYLMYHGMAIRMYQTIPWYGLMQRLLRWSTAASLPPWNTAMIGHFHSCGFWQINRLNAFLTGTMATDDDWSLQALGMESAPAWWLFGVSQKRPVTWQFKMELR